MHVVPANLPNLLNIRQRSPYNLRGNVGLALQDPQATIELNSTALYLATGLEKNTVTWLKLSEAFFLYILSFVLNYTLSA